MQSKLAALRTFAISKSCVRYRYASPLFVQALNLLLPPKQSGASNQPTIAGRCHGGTIANNLSSTFALDPTSDNLEKAERWAMNSIHIARNTLAEATGEGKIEDAHECGLCLTVGLFNAGLIKEVCSAGIYFNNENLCFCRCEERRSPQGILSESHINRRAQSDM